MVDEAQHGGTARKVALKEESEWTDRPGGWTPDEARQGVACQLDIHDAASYIYRRRGVV